MNSHSLISCIQRPSALAALLLLGSVAAAVPSTITVAGYLDNAEGDPLNGDFAASVTFHASADSSDSLHVVTTEAAVRLGAFSIGVVLPPDLVRRDTLWYSIAVDTEGDGLSAEDEFPDRLEVRSVPAALEAGHAREAEQLTPAEYYELPRAGRGSVGSYLQPTVMLESFRTPREGILFDTLFCSVASFESPYNAYSFGVYDRNGNLIAESGWLNTGPRGEFPENVAYIHNTGLAARVETSYLPGNTEYFAAIAREGKFAEAPDAYRGPVRKARLISSPASLGGKLPANIPSNVLYPRWVISGTYQPELSVPALVFGMGLYETYFQVPRIRAIPQWPTPTPAASLEAWRAQAPSGS